MIISIHPDNYTNPNTPDKCDASSPLWAELIEKSGYKVNWVDVYRADILDQLKGSQGFMWRWAHFNGMGRVAKRLLPVIENILKIPVYPDQNTCWHYDDKIAQAYLFESFGIPTPKTWIWFNPNQAKEWASTARYPLVLKLSSGAGASNVKLVNNFKEASVWIDRLFVRRVTSLNEEQFAPAGLELRLKHLATYCIHGDKPAFYDNGFEVQSGYAYFQEYLPDNQFDTRVTVIGNRAFGYRRFNRPNDFRASGSGNFDTDPSQIDPEAIKLSFDVANKIKSQSVALDILKNHTDFYVGEVSYTYISWMVKMCPGHWDSDLNWHEEAMWPEEAQIQDYLRRVQLSEAGAL